MWSLSQHCARAHTQRLQLVVLLELPTVVQELQGRAAMNAANTVILSHKTTPLFSEIVLFSFFFLNESYMFHESLLHSRITSARRENKSVVLVKPGFSLQVQKQYRTLVVNTFWTRLLKMSSVKKYTHLTMTFFIFDHKQELRESKRNGLETC